MILGVCENAGFILRIAVKLVKYLHYIIPFILIVMIIYDLARTMMGPVDDKAKKEAATKAGKRVLYAVLVFLIPTFINLIFEKLSTTSSNTTGTTTDSMSWTECWLAEYNK